MRIIAKKCNYMAKARKTVDKATKPTEGNNGITTYTIETNIGLLELSGKLDIGVKVLSEYKKKAFFYGNKMWFINNNGIIHMCY